MSMSSETQTPSANEADRVIIFDTTLRDGEQSPGASMNQQEKVRIAQVLDEMGVDVIEAGFPIASNGDFEAVKAVSENVQNATICGLSRAAKGDIARCAEAIAPAPNQRIHTFISTSPLHMKYKLQMDPEDVLQAVTDSVTYARSLVHDVEWSAEDATRTEHDFLCRTVEAAITAGARTINVPDTVGYTVPQEYFELIDMLMNRVPNIDQAVISVHCHNDLGLAVANSLAALRAGARQVECTINGLGERAGNAAMEEVVMALRTRPDSMPYHSTIDTTQITRASRLVSAITGFVVQPNKAIVGDNAFAHESGIHQDGVLKHAETYEIMTPESVGLNKSNLVMGKHSGRHAFRSKLAELGYGELGDNAINDAFKRFKDLADAKKEVYDDDIVALVDDEVVRANDHIRLVEMKVTCGTNISNQSAKVTVEVDGDLRSASASGDGPVDATFNAIKEVTTSTQHLVDYQVHSVTGGTDAQAEATVRLNEDGKTVLGQGADTDTMVASAKAYINALNKLMFKRTRRDPGDVVSADAG